MLTNNVTHSFYINNYWTTIFGHKSEHNQEKNYLSIDVLTVNGGSSEAKPDYTLNWPSNPAVEG